MKATKADKIKELMDLLKTDEWIRADYSIYSKYAKSPIFHITRIYFLLKHGFIKAAYINLPETIGDPKTKQRMIPFEARLVLLNDHDVEGRKYPNYLLKVKDFEDKSLSMKEVINELLKSVDQESINPELLIRAQDLAK